MPTMTNVLERYYNDAIKVVELFKEKGFPIDKLHTLVGHEESIRFRFAAGICNLAMLRSIAIGNSEKKAQTGFKYSNKQGVIKMRVNQPKLADLVTMNYEVKIMNPSLKTGDFIMDEEIINVLPDIGKRKKLLDDYFNSRCTGVINYNEFQTIHKCVKKRLS
jgi:hypothetical protein